MLQQLYQTAVSHYLFVGSDAEGRQGHGGAFAPQLDAVEATLSGIVGLHLIFCPDFGLADWRDGFHDE